MRPLRLPTNQLKKKQPEKKARATTPNQQGQVLIEGIEKARLCRRHTAAVSSNVARSRRQFAVSMIVFRAALYYI
jgi:hypothetical protein